VLWDNANVANDALSVSGNGTFTFATQIASGGAYAVTVHTSPSGPPQICTATGGTPASGTATSNVTVAFTCVTQYTISAAVTGLSGSGLVLWDNANVASDPLAISTDGTYTFTTKIAAGGAYAVTVHTQPSSPAQICAVTGATPASGTANTNITVAFTCTNQYVISATVTGLTGTGLVLQDNGGDSLTFNSNGTSPFAIKIASGGAYAVTVQTQPAGTPAQYCLPIRPSGTATAATTVTVSCKNVGQFVFVANPYDNSAAGSVAAFTIAPTTGVLAPASGSPYVSPELQPFGLAVDPNGQFLYVANSQSASVSTYGIGTGGVLTPDISGTGSPASTGAVTNQPFSLVIDPAGPYLYVGSADSIPSGVIEGFSLTAGALGGLSASPYPAGATPYGIAVDSTDTYVYVANVFDGTVDSYSIGAGGNLTALSASPDFTLSNPRAVATYPTTTGQFVYVTDNVANTVQEYSYDNTGTLTPVGSAYNVGSTPQGIAIDPTGSFLYVSNSGNGTPTATDGTVSAFTINATTGALIAVAGSPFTASGTPSTSTPTALAVDPSGHYLYVANGDAGTISVFTIAAGTGVLGTVNLAVPCVSAGGGPSSIVIE
jgi:6-phosphogluconolactonase